MSAEARFGIATLRIRDWRIVEASDGAGALLDQPVAALVGRPFLEVLPPEERARMEDRHARRLRGEPVPSEFELRATLPDGRFQALEAQVAVDGADLLVVLRDVTARVARRPRLEALAALGAVFRREGSEAGIFARLREELAKLGLFPLLMRPEADGVVLEWARVPSRVESAFHALRGRALTGLTGPWGPFSRAVWTHGVAYSDDWASEAGSFVADPAGVARGVLAAVGLTRAIAVRLDERAGARFYLVVAGNWLRAEDVPALRLFGGQVAAALDASRTIADLQRHVADLTALNRIAAHSGEAADLEGFFRSAEGILQKVAGAKSVGVFVLDEPRQELVHIHAGSAPESVRVAFARMPVRGIIAEVIQARSARVISAETAAPGKREVLLAAGFWSAACVPLVVRSRVIGVLMVAFDASAEATRPRLDLLTAAGAHFAGAIESRGLLDDLRRRVSELTLLNDVAMASAQLDPVLLLESALRRIAETFGADVALAYLREGERLDLVSSIGLGAEAARQYGRVPLAEGGLVAEALHRLGPVRIDDVGAADPVSREAARLEVAVAVPLLAKGQSAKGAIAIGRRSRAPFSDSDITLLSAVGVQVGVALENARLFANVRRRLSDLEAVHALALRIFGNAPGDVQGLLDDGCREAARALGCRGAMVVLVSEDRTRLRSVARWGLPADAPAVIDVPLERDRLAADAIRARAPAWSRDAVHDPRSPMHGMRSVPPLVMLAVPLTSRRETRGVLYLSDDAGRTFSDAELALANALAGELAVGLENAELYAEARGRAEELGRLHAELARTQDQLIHKERLAALGELSAVVAHEVRNPLGVIFNSLGSLRRLLRPEGDARMLMDILGEEADRLNRIVGDLLDFARPAAPQVRPEPLERVVDEAVAAALVQDAEGIQLERRALPGLPLVPIDAGQVRQAVVNVAVNAIQAMPRGGRLTVTTRPDGGGAAIELADTGPGMPEEVRARIFEPFFTTKASGTGLGLAVVKRIVEGHGGEISVESRPGAGTTFVLRFPRAAAGPATGAGVATARIERSNA